MSEATVTTSSKKRYVILVAGMIIQLCAGIIYAWSAFSKRVGEHLGGIDSSMVVSVMLVCFVLGILIGGNILDKIGTRPTCIAGSILMSVGILASSLVTSSAPSLIFVTYAVMGGFGVGMIYTCTVSPIQKWFFDKRGFATGMMVCSFGFATVIFAPLAKSLLESQGVPTTFQIFGVVFLIVCTLASFLIVNPPADYSTSTSKTSVLSSQKQYTTREMFGRKSFYLITFSLFFVLSVYFALNPYIGNRLGIDRLGTEDLAILAVMVTGVCSASGRLIVTWISDKIGRTSSVLLIVILSAFGAIGMIFAHDIVFFIFIAIISFAFGGAAGIYATITADHFGTKNMGSNYGFVMLGFGASALVFIYLTKYIVGATGTDFTTPLIITVVACAAALVCALLLRTQKDDQPTDA
jgi:OFA family oxalate/formate antiporter-like MFS transporter